MDQDQQDIVQYRRQTLQAQLRNAETKYREAKRIAIFRKTIVDEIRARLNEVQQIEGMLVSGMAAIEAEASVSASEMITSALEHPEAADGMTIGQLSAALPSIKKQHLSATLYNLKKRNVVAYTEATGLYQIIRNITNPQYVDSHSVARQVADRLTVEKPR